MPGSLSPASDALDKGVGIGMVLAILLGLLNQAVIWFFNLNISSEVSLLLVPLAIGCSVPINLYILFHRMTLPLPTWLTSGKTVAFGGIVSNICGEVEKPYSDTEGDGGWACFPSNVQMWLDKMAGPGGWRHLFQMPCKLVACLIVTAGIMVWLALIVAVLRNPGCLYEASQRYEERRSRRREQHRQCEKCDHCVEKGDYDLIDMEKD